MLQQIKQFYYASRETKCFILTWFAFGLCIIATGIYCYARLDFVRSYKTETLIKHEREKITDVNKTRLPPA